MTKASDNAFPSILITEATEPSAPAAGKQRLYIDSTTHLLKATNSSGTDRTIEGLADAGTATYLDFTNASAPGTPASGKTRIYTKTDKAFYQKDDAGVETGLAGGGGGGITQAYVGYNTVGASTESAASNSLIYYKSVTLANDCLVTDIEANLGAASGSVLGPACAIFSDNGGVPGMYLGGGPTNPIGNMNTLGFRWCGQAIGRWCTAGTYWLAVRTSDAGGAVVMQIKYDTGGSDRSLVSGAGTWVDPTGTTNTTRNYSIRANTIR